MRDVAVSPSLPTIPVSLTPAGTRVSSGPAAAAIKLLAAAPAALLAKISTVTTVAPHGLVAQIRGGPSVYFGDDTELSQKWIAASVVLGDPGSAGAEYIDVTDPQRPAAGCRQRRPEHRGRQRNGERIDDELGHRRDRERRLGRGFIDGRLDREWDCVDLDHRRLTLKSRSTVQNPQLSDAGSRVLRSATDVAWRGAALTSRIFSA